MDSGPTVRCLLIVTLCSCVQTISNSHVDEQQIQNAYNIFVKTLNNPSSATVKHTVPLFIRDSGQLLPLNLLSNLIEVLTDSALQQLTMNYEDYVAYYNTMIDTKWLTPVTQLKNYLYPNKNNFLLLKSSIQNYNMKNTLKPPPIPFNNLIVEEITNSPLLVRSLPTGETIKTPEQLENIIMDIIKKYIYMKLSEIGDLDWDMLDKMLVNSRQDMEQMFFQQQQYNNAYNIREKHLYFFYDWMARIEPTEMIHAADSLEDLLMFMGHLAETWLQQCDYSHNIIPIQPLSKSIEELFRKELLDLYLVYLHVRLQSIGPITVEQLKLYDRLNAQDFTKLTNQYRKEDPNGVVPFLYDMMVRIELDVHKGRSIENLMEELALTAQSYSLTLAERNKRLNVSHVNEINPAEIKPDITFKPFSDAENYM